MKHANPELAQIKIGGMSRSSFLVRGALATGTVYGLGAVTPAVNKSLAQGGGDIEILNFALTLEYLEAAFYAQALKDVGGLSGATKKLAREIRDNEDAHVDALVEAINGAGGTPTEAPGVDFGNAFKNENSFLKLAVIFEDTGVSAYNGAGPMIKNPDILAAAGSIVQVEARHAGLVRLAAGETPAPDAFDPTLTVDEVLEAVQPFLA